MSHRLYLYACQQIGKTEDSVCLLEWNYELPLVFHACFAGDGRVAKPIWNGKQGGLYVSAAAGLQVMEDLYALLDRHQARLIENPEEYAAARDRVLSRLRECQSYQWLHLDAWDVFNMDPTPHVEQAQSWLANLQQNAMSIADAIAQDDPSLLDALCHSVHRTSLKSYLAEPGFDYGWGPLDFDGSDDDSDTPDFPEIVEVGGRFGLKKAGQTLIEPRYDAIYGFDSETHLAVVSNAGLCGYINAKGEEVVPLVFDDLFDFDPTDVPDQRRAQAQKGGLFGLIDGLGQWQVAPQFDEILHLHTQPEPGCWTVRQGRFWGVIGANGQVLWPCNLLASPENDETYPSSFFVPAQEDVEARRFTLDWQPMALCGDDVSVIRHQGQPCYRVEVGEGKQTRFALLDPAGQLLLPLEFDELTYCFELQVFLCRQCKKIGAFAPDTGWVFPCEYDKISKAGLHQDGYAVLQKGRRYGVYAFHKGQWILPCEQPKTYILAKNLILISSAKDVRLHRLFDGALVADQLDYATDLGGCLSFAAALAFKNDQVFCVSQTGGLSPIQRSEIYQLNEFYLAWLEPHWQALVLKQLPVTETAAIWFDLGVKANTQQNLDGALFAFNQAFALEHVGAARELGRLYDEEASLQDLEKARQFYQFAADRGDANAINNIGCLLFWGKGVERDIPAGVACFKQAIALGNHPAAINLGLRLYYGDELPEDLVEAKKLLLMAWPSFPKPCELGWLFAQEDNWKEAQSYYEKAARDNDADALFALGLHWSEGDFGAVDVRKAKQYLKRAVAAGHKKAAGLLSRLLT